MNFSYQPNYDSNVLRGTEDKDARPWDLTKEIIQYSNKDFNLLDIGCGTSFKLIPLSPYFKSITGIDISEDMITASKKNIIENNISNFSFRQCDSNNLPFEDKTFNIITCMVSKWDIKEIYRVLKPNGIIIIEHIGCEDKKDFKIYFGKDLLGWRGQFIEHEKNKYIQDYYNIISQYFNEVSIRNGFWKTHYSYQGILELLKYTPTIRNFDPEKDFVSLKKACEIYKTSKGIELTQNRILIHAKNPNYF